MKKISILILLLVFGFNLPCYSFVSPFDLSKKEIKDVLNCHNKAMDKYDFEKIKTYYSKDYKNSDGFELDDVFEMLEKTRKAYGDIKYKTKINDISLYDNWAVVQMSDESRAKINHDNKKDKDKTGYLKGRSSYILYLKKDDDGWKIVADDILMEETSLKFGIAKKMDINLITPVFVKPGSEYDLRLEMNKPDDILAIGSISREEIKYPPSDYEEKFRKISQDGELERLVRANNNDLDEYALASIGFTKVSVNKEQTRARIEVLGMAYIMKRVNTKSVKTVKGQLAENN